MPVVELLELRQQYLHSRPFNSLFEMLTLRNPPRGQEQTPFNSLFEMHTLVVSLPSDLTTALHFQFSI